MNLKKPLILLAAVGLLAACGEATEGPSGPNGANNSTYEFVPSGKADNYRSTKGREYLLEGMDSVVLSEEDAQLEDEARQEAARELVELKFKAISYFAYEYLSAKSSDYENADYGDFSSTIRQQTFESLEIEERNGEPGTFDYKFEAEAAGPRDLMEELPLSDEGTFDLMMPKLSNDEIEDGSYSRSHDDFDADNYEADELTSIELAIEAQEAEPDAYPEYNEMFEDGLLDIAIHVGGDYNDARYDIRTAKDLFRRLQTDMGLEAPVDSYDELKSDSGPFVGTMDANGEEIRIEVKLIHPDMQKEEGVGFDGLIESYRESASKSDIIIYDGHAGYTSSYSGVVVHYNPRHAIAADDFDELELPDKYQLFVFNGCKTYTSYADAMYNHPEKDSKNLDIVTTVNFSWLSQMTRVTTDLLGHVTDQQSGTHAPRSYDQILTDLNSGRNWDVIYGVHGLSDNPHRSPYAQTDTICSSCTGSNQCPGVDNLCLNYSGGSGCSIACTADSGCPDGYTCESVAQEGSDLISASQCVPTYRRCD